MAIEAREAAAAAGGGEAAAGEAPAEVATVVPGETAEVASSETADATPEAAATTEEAPAAADTKAKPDRASARFAELARRDKAVRDHEVQLDAKLRTIAERERVLTDRERANDTRIAEREKAIEAREARAREADERDHLLLTDSLEKVADRLVALGVTDRHALEQLFSGRWAEHRKRAELEERTREPSDPKKRTMTVEEYERRRAEDDRVREQQAAAQTKFDEFDRGFDTSKHEAATLLYSRNDRIREGNRIAGLLQERGKGFTLDDIREAVNALAEQDERWDKIRRRAAKAPGATTTAAGSAPAPKAPASSARSGTSSTTPPKAAATTAAATSDKASPNGASIRKSHRQRIAELMRG